MQECVWVLIKHLLHHNMITGLGGSFSCSHRKKNLIELDNIKKKKKDYINIFILYTNKIKSKSQAISIFYHNINIYVRISASSSF